MENLLTWLNTWILAPIVPALLIVSGIILGFRTRFIHLTRIPTIVRSLTKRSEGSGKQSPFRSLTVALAGTLGVGNIAGVASAIVSGGAGAILWMWIGAILSMPVKYAEVVLAVRHRITRPNGEHSGGAMYYMKKRALALPFSILCICASLTLGNLMQINAVADTADSVFNIPPLPLAAAVCLFLYPAIRKGIKRISSVTAFLVPIMSLLYVLLCLFVIIPNLKEIPSILLWILRDAFRPSAALGGIGGFLLMRSMRYGISRGLVSNEAGCGTAPIAHASADTESPVRQGFLGIFEVFADTIIMCSLTAFVVLLSIEHYPHLDSMELVIACFSRYLGESSGYLLAICVFFFALATMIGWSYYGMISLDYLTGSRRIKHLYILLYVLITLPGAVMSGSLMWQFTDFTVGIMTVINTSFLLTRVGEIGRETDRFFSQIKPKRAENPLKKTVKTVSQR
ncbi:MAG: alanine/glycine:cation symporter family protein [Eubacteriales bacterium]